jgi:hypothetical protein
LPLSDVEEAISVLAALARRCAVHVDHF